MFRREWSAILPKIELPSRRSTKSRSGFTNNPYKLEGVDGRSPRARRYRDVVDALIGEFGLHDPVAIRELAGLKITLEMTQGQVVAGDSRAREDLVRVSNLIARREKEMRDAKLARPDVTPSIADIAARHRATKATAP